MPMPGLHKSFFPMGSHCCPFEDPTSHKSSTDFLPQSGFTEMEDLSCLSHSQCWLVLSVLTGLRTVCSWEAPTLTISVMLR